MTDHTVKAFDDELKRLKTAIAQMGGIAEEQLANAMDALSRRDIALADRVIAADHRIDELEDAIEDRAVVVIAKRQPMANDLREILVAIRVASDLERIGDLAKNLAKRTLAIPETQPRNAISGLSRMSALAQDQLQRVLDAYARSDANLALEVWRADEEIDALYNSVFRELLTYMMEDPRTIGVCTHLLFGAKNLERIGDHTTNIAENIYFQIHGRQIPEERQKKDTTSVTAITGE